jgi:DNA-directed RNA polymerase sigma subunit (sigma70/sigma32)
MVSKGSAWRTSPCLEPVAPQSGARAKLRSPRIVDDTPDAATRQGVPAKDRINCYDVPAMPLEKGPWPNRCFQSPQQDLVPLYLTDVGRHPLLTKDDEVRLAQVVQAGREAHTELAAVGATSSARVRELRRVVRAGEAAAETFTNSNLRLVVSIARQYRDADLPLLDLVQEGNLGLMHAVEKFDWRKGFKFSTYASWWIRQAIARGITNNGPPFVSPFTHVTY